MEGILFLTDDTNTKVAVQIDLKVYGELWEEFYDRLIIEERKDEESDSLEYVLEQLKKEGLLDE